MYKVLYRKWRPQTFADVVGQPHVTLTLEGAIKANRLSHAYLFTGSRGTGKTSCAKILSKAVNCLDLKGGNPCNECEMCRGIDSGSVLDVLEIDAASNRGIDDIRALREESVFTPAQAKYRVYIIDEVHMLTIEAFNALLKTLEEPPGHVIFILATTEVQKLPSTILSRCQRFDFRRIEPEAIAARLEYVAEQEGTSIEHDAAVLIARIADGAARDALSILDRCIASGEKMITVGIVRDAAGIIGSAHLYELSSAIYEKNCAKALMISDELHKASFDAERFCIELSNHFRNIMIAKTVENVEELVVATKDEIVRLKEHSALFSLEETLRAIEILTAVSESLRRSKNGRIETEMAMIRLCTPQLDSDTSALAARVAELEKSFAGGAFVRQAQAQMPADKAEPQIQAAVKAESKTEPQIQASVNAEDSKPLKQDIQPDTQASKQAETPQDNTNVNNLPFEPDDYAENDNHNTAESDDDFDLNDIEDLPFSDDDEYTEPPPAEPPSHAVQEALPEAPPAFSAAPDTAATGEGAVAAERWAEICAEAARICAPMMSFIKGTYGNINGEVLIVTTPNILVNNLFNTNPAFGDALSKAAEKYTGKRLKVKAQLKGD